MHRGNGVLQIIAKSYTVSSIYRVTGLAFVNTPAPIKMEKSRKVTQIP